MENLLVHLNQVNDVPVHSVLGPEFASYVHLDYDEANACGFRKGDLGRILP